MEEVINNLGQRLGEANTLIKILNSKTKDELVDFEIETILEVRRVLTKSNLLVQLENICQHLDTNIQKFHKKFNSLHLKGLLGLKGIGDKLVPLVDYQ